MFILKKGHQPGVYVPLRALFLVAYVNTKVQISCVKCNSTADQGLCFYFIA